MARLAKSLTRLWNEVDAVRPERSRISDGWIGDEAHRARKSDHNPNGAGVVTAIDTTDDRNTLGREIWNYLILAKDHRVKYVIFEGQMFSFYSAHGYRPWTPRPYNGINSHAHHIHISVREEASLYDSARSWGFLSYMEDKQKEEEKIVAYLEENLTEDEKKWLVNFTKESVDRKVADNSLAHLTDWHRHLHEIGEHKHD